MSKNRNYQNCYSNPVVDEPANEFIEQQTEESKETEDISETVSDAVLEEAKTPVTKNAIVINANLVNMRENPVKDAAIICQVKKGTVVEIGGTTTIDPDWSHIKVNNKTGFMMSKFLKEI